MATVPTCTPPPAPSAGCGFSWNTLHCNLWSESQGGNGYYLDTMDNGLGMEETYHWVEARNNTHGGYGTSGGVGGNNSTNDPLSCDGHDSSGYPCDEADDQAWSRIVLTERDSTVVEEWSPSPSPLTTTTTYHYLLTTFGTNTQLCSDCTASMYWGSQNDMDWQDYYNGRFMGFVETDVNQADGSVQKYHYDTTTGWGVYDTGQVPCGTNPPRQSGSVPCHASPWWNLAVAGHGRAKEVDDYDTNGTTLLAKQATGYTLTCPPSGVQPTPTHSWDGINTGSFDNMNVAMVDLNNPVAACEIHATQTDSYTYDGSSSAVHSTTTATYDTYGRLSSVIADSHGGGGALGSPTQIETYNDYTWDDNVTTGSSSATGTYILDRLADTVVEDTGAQTHYRCAFVGYDGHAPQQGATNSGSNPWTLVGEATKHESYTSCGTNANGFTTSGPVDTTTAYDSYGNVVADDDPDAVTGNSAHLGCTTPSQGSTLFTSCTLIDPSFQALPTASASTASATDVLTTSLTYGTAGGSVTPAATNGFGLWPISVTDPNVQVTSTTYDALGRTTSVTLPGEASGETTSSTTYTIWCTQGTNGGTSGAQAPCVEVDTTQRLDSTHTVTSRAFYDGFGRLVETRSPAPGGEDVVAFVAYDIMGRPMQQSVRFEVTAYTGGPGAAAFWAFPSSGMAATKTSYDGLGRVTETIDPQSNATKVYRGPQCGVLGDSACYEAVSTIDPLSHDQQALVDAFGRTAYSIAFIGNGTSGNPYAYYAVTTTTYDYAGDVTKVLEPDGSHTLTYTYDNAGRVTAMSDPDRGSESYGYDANGNLTQSVDARGSAGTVYLGYDGLNRPLWRNTSNSSSGAYVTYTYDTGTYGAGRLSEEDFNQGAGQSLGVGKSVYTYDARGQTTALSEVVDGTTYGFSFGYNDAGQPTSVGYSDGTYLCESYDSASGWLSSVAITAAGTSSTVGCTASGQTTLASGLAYSGDAGAAGLVTAASVNPGNPDGTTYSYAASYDEDLRLLSSSLSASGSTLYQVQPGYDAASDVTAVATTLPGSVTDNQAFCYDEQNRLTWASSQSASGPDVPGPSTPCATNTAGTLTGGNSQYTATYAYDNLDRLTSGPANGGSTYTYGDAAHLHAATATSGGYSATYDAAGDMTCRAPTSSTTCTGSSPTGAGLSYDHEGQLVSWTSALTGQPTPATDAFAYDGEGARVAQQTTSGGSGITTTTDYLLGGLEEQQTVGGSVRPSTTLTEYYPIPGVGTAVRVDTSSSSTLSYLAGDQLGSVSVALNTTGTVTAQALYSPYGTVRYASGTMPTAHGYTGQLADAVTGLDYYGARYYDPALGQFTSADSVLDGLNRYAYVGGSPETLTDPSGYGPAPADTVYDILTEAKEVAAAAWAASEAAGIAISATTLGVIGIAVAVIAVSAYLLYQNVTTPYPTYLSQYHGAAPTATPTPQPVWGPPAASPGSSQWTLPDKDYIRGAENAHPAPTPHNGPTNKPGPGTGTPPATQPSGGGANGGAGVTPPTGSCGCPPDESGGGSDSWITLYHGTTANEIASIIENGVDRPFNTTRDPDVAAQYAREAMLMEGEGARGQVLTLRMQQSVLEALMRQGAAWEAQVWKYSSATKIVFEQGAWDTLNRLFEWGEYRPGSGGC